MKCPVVSVLMPVYNAERYVAEAVESILTQTFTDFEFLIIDDGSTDGSLEILRRYEQSDDRIRLISRPNTGYLVALNEMLAVARGEFIARMDADDISLPERLERQIAYLQSYPMCVAIGTCVLVVDPDGDPLCEWNKEQDHNVIDALHLDGRRGSVICHPSVMIRKQAIIDVGNYRDRFYMVEDFDLFLRLAEIGELANLPTALFKYRMHPGSICHINFDRQRELVQDAILEALGRRGLDAVLPIQPRPRAIHSETSLAQKWAWWALKAGYIKTARKYVVTELLRSPFSLGSWRLLYCVLRGY